MKTTVKQMRCVIFSIAIVLQSIISAHALVDLGNVQTTTIGHTFFDPIFIGVPNSVIDVLVDQDQSSGGGGLLQSVSANFDLENQFRLTVSAPAGQRFLVHVPAGRAVRFGGYLEWSFSGGFATPSSVAVTFGGLEGTAPDFSESDSVLSGNHAFFGFFDITSSAFTTDIAFSSITFTATVPSADTGLGMFNYNPELASQLGLSYTTSETIDPGRFVSIVPEPSATALLLLGTLLSCALRKP